MLCEVFDGQWHSYITNDKDGKSLTKLSWRHKWQEVVTYSKNKCIEKMVDGCRIKPGDTELLSISKKLQHEEETTHGNINVTCSIVPVGNPEKMKKKKTLTVSSTGGRGFNMPVMKQFVTVCKHSRPDLFPNEIGYSTCHTYADKPGTPCMPPKDVAELATSSARSDDHTYCETINTAATDGEKKHVKRKKILGIDGAEDNILHLLDQSTVSLILDDLEDLETPENVTSAELLVYILKDERCLLLGDVLTQLQYFDCAKWGATTQEELFPTILSSGSELMSRCTVKDIKIICKTLEHHTDRCWFESGAVKTTHVNRIVRAFGGTELIQEKTLKRKRNVQSPSALKVLAKKILLCEDYMIEHLHISLGTVMSRQCKADWFRRCTVNPTVFVPFADGDDDSAGGESVELFSYPEVGENDELKFKTFDYTHILTNMRSHILNRGYDFCKREDFEWIVDNTTGILSRYLVEYNMDSQNAFSAMKLFGDTVILTLESNGRFDSVEFLKLVKGWHMACDERGIPADVRVRGHCDIYKFLTKDLNFWSVPFQHPGRYIRGMTWQTFEALLQTVTTRIQLYEYATGCTYNARSVSTLANESFFADLVRLDKEGKGYPKASNIGKVMGRVVMLNHFKHKRNKNYTLAPTLKPKYPPHMAEADNRRLEFESEEQFEGVYRDHFFDFKDDRKSQHCRRWDITTGLQALRGVSGVRAYFKVNESKILPEVRAGNKPKGFSTN